MELYKLDLPEAVKEGLRVFSTVEYNGVSFSRELLEYKEFDLSKKIDLEYEFKNINKYIKKKAE